MRKEPAPGLWALLGRAWVPVGLLLLLDFLKSYAEVCQGLPLPEILGNLGVVLLCALPAVLVLALALGILERAAARLDLRGYRQDASNFVLFFLTYAVNVLYLKYRLIFLYMTVPLTVRAYLSLLLLMQVPLLYWLLRRRWGDFMQAAGECARPVLGSVAGLGALLCIAALATGGTGVQPAVADSSKLPPDIILVTFDSLTSRHMSCYGYERPTTPNLDELARESVRVTGMHPNSNTTVTSMPSFQGYYRMPSLPGKSWTRVLAEHGYSTVCFVSSGDAGEQFNIPDMPRTRVVLAFQAGWPYRALAHVFPHDNLRWLSALGTREFLYYNPFHPYVHLDRHRSSEHAPPWMTFQAGLELLREHPRGAFVWIHVWVPHYPYLPAPPYLGKFGPPTPARDLAVIETDEVQLDGDLVRSLKDRYDEYVLMGDALFGRFVAELKASGRYDDSILIVSADHGESFDQGYWGHGGPNNRGSLEIPLIMHLPGVAPAVSETFAEPVDLAPTLLDYLGVAAPPEMHGESLLPYARDPSLRSTKPKLSVSYPAYTRGAGDISVFWKKFCLTYRREDPARGRLVDVVADPDGRVDLTDRQPELVEKLKQVVRF